MDKWYASSIPAISIAGDSGGIAGASAAERQGRIAALQAIHELGHIDASVRDERARPLIQEIAHYACMRPFLDAAFPPAPNLLVPPDDEVTICRCECVTARQIRDVMAAGASTTQEVKLATRCAMGPCQGRQCASTLQEMVQAQSGAPIELLRQRSPVEPLTLGEWSSLAN